MSTAEIETPADLHEGEIVEAIRLGGPRDGDTIGYFTVEREGDGLALNFTDGQEMDNGSADESQT